MLSEQRVIHRPTHSNQIAPDGLEPLSCHAGLLLTRENDNRSPWIWGQTVCYSLCVRCIEEELWWLHMDV